MRASPWLKLDRAREHLETLQREVGAYTAQPDKCGIVFETDQQGKRHLMRIRISEPPPLERWGLIVGDCVHNARSALDHGVWMLSGQPFDGNDTRTQFPIFEEAIKFHDRKRGLNMIASVNDHRARAIIKWVQPYRRRDVAGDLLGLLHALDIADKHKLLAVHAVVPERLDWSYESAPGTIVANPEWLIAVDVDFEDGAYLGQFRWSEAYASLGEQPEMNVKAHLAVDVIFSEGVPLSVKGYVVISSLQLLVARTSKILKSLFPEG